MKRGDVVLFDFPFSDGTGSKLRSALMVQADFLNQAISDSVLALITRTPRNPSTEVLIDISTGDGAQSGLHHTSVVDCKNLLTVDQRFVHRTIGILPDVLMQQVNEKLKASLGLQ
jgi:mRNA interferase MazF